MQATLEEIQEALIKDGVKVKGKNQLRDAQWDPFVRRAGHIEGVNEGDSRLERYANQYGKSLADLVLAKRREIEVHCPSGHYPVKSRRGDLSSV